MSNLAQRRPYTFDRVIRIVFTIIAIVAVLWLFNYLKGVLLPFLVACLMAYMIQPFVQFNRKMLHLKSNILAIMITLFEILLIIVGGLYFFLPYIISEIDQMIVLFTKYAQEQLDIPYIPNAVHDFIIKYVDFEKMKSMFTQEQWVKLFDSLVTETLVIMDSSIKVVVSILSWMVVFLYLVFILLDYEKIMNGFKNAVPQKYQATTFKILHDIERSMNHYFRGQSLISLIVGILFSIGFIIIGLPLAVVFGLFIGILNMVPYLQLLSIPLAAVLCLVSTVSTGIDFWLMFGKTIAVYCIVQAIQDMYLTPKIMGKYMGLNPAIIFLSLSIWGTILGFMGLIIALPLTTLLISYYDQYVIHIPVKIEELPPAEVHEIEEEKDSDK